MKDFFIVVCEQMAATPDHSVQANLMMYILVDFVTRCGLLPEVKRLQKEHGVSPILLYLRAMMRGPTDKVLRGLTNPFETGSLACGIANSIPEDARQAYFKIFDELAKKPDPRPRLRMLKNQHGHKFLDNVAGENEYDRDFPPAVSK